jgi:hypothetical protein
LVDTRLVVKRMDWESIRGGRRGGPSDLHTEKIGSNMSVRHSQTETARIGQAPLGVGHSYTREQREGGVFVGEQGEKGHEELEGRGWARRTPS